VLLALDQGTTSSRAILFDRTGATVASAQQEFAQHYPQPGWVEHDPADLWGVNVLVGDQQASLFGQGCLSPGCAKVTYGTGCFLLANTGASLVRSQHKLLTTVAWRIQNSTTYALEGSVFVAGAAIQWLRDELRLVSSAQEVDTLAASVRDTGGVVFVPAFAGLGTPYWDADARGLLIGMTRGTNRAQLCRAVLEAIAHQTVDILECMEADSSSDIGELRTDGGAARSDVLRQIQADLLGRHVVAGDSTEATAWGAAALSPTSRSGRSFPAATPRASTLLPAPLPASNGPRPSSAASAGWVPNPHAGSKQQSRATRLSSSYATI
jgi:glycerol kinase